jgi:hypothetical protein
VTRNLCYALAIVLVACAAAAGQIVPVENLRTTSPPSSATSYQPITGGQRFDWFMRSTVGGESLAAGLFSAGLGTAINRPTEYGPHWDGFGKRYAMRLTGISTGNAIEAGLGSLWGEDPRYFPATGQPIKGRLKNVVLMTFAARQADGSLDPAYARYIGTVGNNFLSNSWRADSESGVGDACLRIALGFAGKMGGNAFAEFWPTARKHIFHRK